ncbi:hypothetical protein CJ030_MR0G027761 [Morella rubra]|uniref:Uncharacterized protein n=1 Tax=Morella rubra TaxID=262757 RepID=A0A6A1UGP5_9ROSI|nr:hypothetical protein CJ030_MR0G027779 [Morella rubra]KAB1199085.1 hypothetical protein CJ030_MR0G027761 [Morella rubra]
MSPIPSPTPSAPSPRANEAMSQGTPACPSSCASTFASMWDEVGHVGSIWKRVWRSVFHCCHPIDKDWNVGRGLIPISVNKWADVPAEVKEYIMDRCWTTSTLTTPVRKTNRMHAYFKKFPSKEAALLKPHPDTTEEQWKELCDMFTSETFMKNQESGINPAELYKKNYTNKDGVWTSEGVREIYRQCDLEGKSYTEIEVYSEILGKKSGYVRGLGHAVKPSPSSTLTTQSSDLQHQLAKARDEIEAMRAAREKDLQEFAKKQAEMEATLRDHREEQRVEQERIRLEQEECMKREQERMRVEHKECMQ